MIKPLLPAGFQLMMIQGVVGALEVCVHVPESLSAETPLLLVSHPHPLHGGNLFNKVVQTIAKAGSECGFLVVCYNFRGVGKSEGQFDHGHGERFDLKAVLDFVQTHWGKRPFVLAGFSFGAWVSALVSQQRIPTQLLMVAPPVSLYPMERIEWPDTLPVTIIQGGADEVVSAQAVLSMSARWKADVLWRHQASHYFHGQLRWLRQACLLTLKS